MNREAQAKIAELMTEYCTASDRLLAMQLLVEWTYADAARVCRELNHGAFGDKAYLAGIADGSVGCANAIEQRAK